jgi:hypothetical protein
MKLKYHIQQKWKQKYIDASLKILKEIYKKNYKSSSLIINKDLNKLIGNDFFSMFELNNKEDDDDELKEYL